MATAGITGARISPSRSANSSSRQASGRSRLFIWTTRGRVRESSPFASRLASMFFQYAWVEAASLLRESATKATASEPWSTMRRVDSCITCPGTV